MKGLVVSLAAMGLFVACGGGSAPTAATLAPPGPVIKYKNSLDGLNATAPVDLIQNVIDFSPGGASVVHIHTSPNLGTVLEGQIAVKIPGGDKSGSAGEMLVEPVNQALQAVNVGSGEAMVLVGFAVPQGGKPTVPVAGKPAPAIPNKTLDSFTLNLGSFTGAYSLVQEVLDFAPGSRTPKQHIGGPCVLTVLQGQLTLSRDGVETTYNAGESFPEMPYQSLQMSNRDGGETVVAATFLLPAGAKLIKNG